MTEQRKKADEKTLLDLLGKGDIAGLERALGLDPGEFERIMDPDPGRVDEGCDDEDDVDLYDAISGASDDGGDWEGDIGLRPKWLHPDCRNVCSALELGTCCLYPDNPLIRVAVQLASTADRAVGRLGEVGCPDSGEELTRCFQMIPGLLAQIHAVLPRLSHTARAQLLCPVGTLAAALDQTCGDGCPWGCGDPALPDRRADFAAMIELVAECSDAIRTTLGWPGGTAREPVVVRPRLPRD